jgi:choline dehydrogenase-like flavoprotein
VIVVGSVRGAAGGIAAYVLTMKGLKVLCLEAGRMLEPSRDFFTHKFPYEWPYLPLSSMCAHRMTSPSKPIPIVTRFGRVQTGLFGNFSLSGKR